MAVEDDDGAIPLGARGLGFCYEACPTIFPHRRGCGPMRMAWDTNVLLDFQRHVPAVWNEEPVEVAEGAVSRVLALARIVDVWMLRDIEIHLLPTVLTDFKGETLQRRVARRQQSFEEMLQALSHQTGGREIHYEGSTLPHSVTDGQLPLPGFDYVDPIPSAPEGADRDLLLESLANDMHVFLTSDRKILREAPRLALRRLLVTSPTGLSTEFQRYGITHIDGGILAHPGCPYAGSVLFPDLERGRCQLVGAPVASRRNLLRTSVGLSQLRVSLGRSLSSSATASSSAWV